MRRTIGVLPALALAAAAAAMGKAVELDAEAERRKKTPPPERDPKYEGIDYGRDPGRSFTVSHADMERINAAQAKRDRKARKRLASS